MSDCLTPTSISPDNANVEPLTEVLAVNGEFFLPTRKSRHVGSSYYTEAYALAVKRTLDMIRAEPGKFIAWPLPAGYRLSSLAQMFHQGKGYLMDHMDDAEHTYQLMCQGIRTKKIQRHNFVGLSIYWKVFMTSGGIEIKSLDKEIVEEQVGEDVTAGWQSKLEDFIEKAATGDTCTLKKIILDEYAKNTLARLLGVFPDFKYYYDQKTRNLKVVRLAYEEVRQLRSEEEITKEEQRTKETKV